MARWNEPISTMNDIQSLLLLLGFAPQVGSSWLQVGIKSAKFDHSHSHTEMTLSESRAERFKSESEAQRFKAKKHTKNTKTILYLRFYCSACCCQRVCKIILILLWATNEIIASLTLGFDVSLQCLLLSASLQGHPHIIIGYKGSYCIINTKVRCCIAVLVVVRESAMEF